MFIAEKQIVGIEQINVDINALEHKADAYRHLNPLTTVPALALKDGRVLSESRAICSWLEGQFPEPNLMGRDFDERAFIEMADRRAEWYLLVPIAQVIRHTHPGLATLEQPQFADYGAAQRAKVLDYATSRYHSARRSAISMKARSSKSRPIRLGSGNWPSSQLQMARLSDSTRPSFSASAGTVVSGLRWR
jgi:glutathione S-transferase